VLIETAEGGTKEADYAGGLRRYRYTGWQHRISPATHAVEFVPPVHRIADRLNAGLVRSGHDPHNHFIVTRYADEEDNIGFHSDKEDDFAINSYFIVLKLGAQRAFAFRRPPNIYDRKPEPFYNEVLDAGTAIFVRCKAPGAANAIVQHGVPRVESATAVSGSIVSRCISTVIPWQDEERLLTAAARRSTRGAVIQRTPSRDGR
jgi:hypothetical protein